MTREQFISHVEAVQGAIRRFLLALCCGDTQLADDIAQEAFMKAYLAADNLKDPAKFKSWVFKIAYTTFISSLRSCRQYADYDSAHDIATPDRAYDAFRYQDLYQALDRLPAKERTSVLLFYMEGYSIKEIADLEEVSAEAVKQHLSRGRSHLRALLSN